MYVEIIELARATSEMRSTILHLSATMKNMEEALLRLVPAAKLKDATFAASDWKELGDMMHVLSGTHAKLAFEIQTQMEEQIMKLVETIKNNGEEDEMQCAREIHMLELELKKTEHNFKKILKSKGKKIEEYQNALNELHAIATEIKVLQDRPMRLVNSQAEIKLPYLLNLSRKVSNSTQEAYVELGEKIKTLAISKPIDEPEADLDSKLKKVTLHEIPENDA